MTVPSWFEQALAWEPDTGAVDVDGAAITWRSWGEPGRPGIVLVHGGAAHARWWDHLAPLFAHDHHVVALDLSGHGDAGRRDAYPPSTWAEEVAAVAEHHGMERPVVVGHSMGGFVAIVLASRMGDRLGGTIIVDSPVRRPDPETKEGRSGRMFAAPKTYPSLEEGMQHFVLIPFQPVVTPYVVEHVAATSLREGDAGWTWKWDPHVFGRFETRDPVYSELLAQVQGPVAVIHGQLSDIVDRDVTDWMADTLGRPAPFVEIPDAYHHLILDQPLAFVAAVRALLATWRH